MNRRYSPEARCGALRAACVLALVAALAACGDRPGSIRDDRPWIQLSATTVRFDLDPRAFATPQEVEVTTPGTQPLPVPEVSTRYVGPDGWLQVSVGGGPSAYRLSLLPSVPRIASLTPGATYSATVSIDAPGAGNTPATVGVELHVLAPSADPGWRLGPSTLAWHAALSVAGTALPDGGVLLPGANVGYGSYGERMDPSTGEWTDAGLDTDRHEHTATLLEDGRVLLAGGETTSDTWEIYDPSSREIAASGKLARARYRHAAVRLSDGRVLLIGGLSDGPTQDLASWTGFTAEVFDPRTLSSRTVGSLQAFYVDLNQQGAVLLRDGRVLIAGGTIYSGVQGVPNEEGVAEIFDPISARWTRTGSLSLRHIDHAMAPLPDGEVLLFGGHDGSGAGGASEIWAPATGAWRLAAPLLHPRAHIRDCAVVLPSGRILVAGGDALAGWDGLASVEIYDPADGRWREGPSLNGRRSWHSVVLLPYGRVMVVGGQGDTANATEFWTEPAG